MVIVIWYGYERKDLNGPFNCEIRFSGDLESLLKGEPSAVLSQLADNE
jgi:hypothetical protein